MTIEWKLVPVEPADEQIIRAAECLHDCGVRFEGDDSEPQQDIAEALYRAMLNAAPEPPNDTMTAAPVQQAEPVAWMRFGGHVIHAETKRTMVPASATAQYNIPLFLHPPAAEVQRLVEAARAVVGRWDSPKWKDETPTADLINELRAALEGVEP